MKQYQVLTALFTVLFIASGCIKYDIPSEKWSSIGKKYSCAYYTEAKGSYRSGGESGTTLEVIFQACHGAIKESNVEENIPLVDSLAYELFRDVPKGKYDRYALGFERTKLRAHSVTFYYEWKGDELVRVEVWSL